MHRFWKQVPVATNTLECRYARPPERYVILAPTSMGNLVGVSPTIL
jgi:hypothetical protein